MALLLKGGAVFLHVPRTGGTWITTVLRKMRLAGRKVSRKHQNFDGWLNYELERMGPLRHLYRARISAGKRLGCWPERPSFKFCFVRHPVTWIESRWKFACRTEWQKFGTANSRVYWNATAVLNELGSPDFNEFIWNVLRRRPGVVTEVFFSYTKPGINFIGRTEHLVDDLAAVLRLLRLPCDDAVMRGTPRVNSSGKDRAPVQWDGKLKRLFLRAELPTLMQFGYLTPELRDELGVTVDIPPHPALHMADQK
jgi:hypothetical protein